MTRNTQLLSVFGRTVTFHGKPATPEQQTALEQVSEPAAAPEVIIAQPLPDGFPGLDALVRAGVYTLDAVPRSVDALVAIRGVGAKTAAAILEALA